MNFTIPQSAFQAELAVAMAAIENKTTLPVSGLIHLETRGQGLIISSTNLELGIKIRVPAVVHEEGSVILGAGRLNVWLSSLSEGDVEFKLGKQASLKCGRSLANMSIADQISFPAFPEVGPHVATISSSVLHTALSKTGFAIPSVEDQGSNTVTCVNLVIEDDQLYAVATNGKRLAIYQHGIEAIADSNFLLSRKAVGEVSKVAAKCNAVQVKVSLNKNNVFFGFGDRLVYSRLVNGNFPNWQKSIMPSEKYTSVAKFSGSLALDALIRIDALADLKTKKSVFKINSEQLALTSFSDIGDSSEAIPVTYSGPETVIGLRCPWVIDGLRAIGSEEVELRFISAKHPVIQLSAVGSSEYRYVVGLIEV